MEILKQHIRTYTSPSNDLRGPIRRIEEQLLSNKYTGLLIGNQCIDFQKQDGVTEIEEAIMANTVERRLNDLLLLEEQAGHVAIHRKPIYVSCVSNFTNFLDLFRKTIRSLEVGIPCIILSRSNTAQHSYRWTKLLVDLLQEENVDPGMVTYLSCSLTDIQHITQSCQDKTGNLYATCSRDLAASIKSGYPNTVASTGGPNTLVALDLTQPIQDAIRCSASIESSGQCTALRHVVVPKTTSPQDISLILGQIQSVPTAQEALQKSIFDGIFANHTGSAEPSSDRQYQRTGDTFYKIRTQDLPSAEDIPEYWRKVVVDVTCVDYSSETSKKQLADWLNTNQPISLAVNGSSRPETLDYGLDLFERTGLVVNTIGTPEQPALTCQARPQEAEIFGEFPPRRELFRYTKYPVVVPSSTPSYDTMYTHDYLRSKAAATVASSSIEALLQDVSNDLVRGYCVLIWEYLVNATEENPKVGYGTSRTAMWGLQRPPLGTTTHLRCSKDTSWDDIAPVVTVFQGTNARAQLAVSVDPSNRFNVQELLSKHGLNKVKTEADDVFSAQPFAAGDNVVNGAPTLIADGFPMVGQLVSTLLPLGHIKSTKSMDEDFVGRVRKLSKWLKTVDK